jgi:hypothetical protein
MTSTQTAAVTAKDMLERGKTTSPNVEMIRIEGVRLVRGKIPAAVRRELRAAVKDGRLGHLPKDGHRPEAFFHPNSKFKAMEAQDREERAALEALAGVVARPFELAD